MTEQPKPKPEEEKSKYYFKIIPKEELNGLALEIFTFDKTRYAEFLDTTQDYIKNALYCVSLNLNVKEEADISK